MSVFLTVICTCISDSFFKEKVKKFKFLKIQLSSRYCRCGIHYGVINFNMFVIRQFTAKIKLFEYCVIWFYYKESSWMVDVCFPLKLLILFHSSKSGTGQQVNKTLLLFETLIIIFPQNKNKLGFWPVQKSSERKAL